MDESDAQKLGIQSVSAVFDMPSDEETIRFAAESTRLVLSSVDENGIILISNSDSVYLKLTVEGSYYSDFRVVE